MGTIGKKKWMTVGEFAAMYQISDRAVYDLIRVGKLTAHRFGTRRGSIRISDEDRLDWERRCRGDGSEVDVA